MHIFAYGVCVYTHHDQVWPGSWVREVWLGLCRPCRPDLVHTLDIEGGHHIGYIHKCACVEASVMWHGGICVYVHIWQLQSCSNVLRSTSSPVVGQT